MTATQILAAPFNQNINSVNAFALNAADDFIARNIDTDPRDQVKFTPKVSDMGGIEK